MQKIRRESVKANPHILNIPPHLSTKWENVHSLTTDALDNRYTLTVQLTDGTQTVIPDLSKENIDDIFSAHAQFHETLTQKSNLSIQGSSEFPIDLSGLKGLETVLQHNQADCNTPDLPKEVLEHLSHLTKNMKTEDVNQIPKPEPHCNCPHCQITRAMHNGLNNETANSIDVEEIVSEEDLQFRSWDIKQKTDALYEVRDPLESETYYHVFLGSPVGCTCGSKSCEHIKAVLTS